MDSVGETRTDAASSPAVAGGLGDGGDELIITGRYVFFLAGGDWNMLNMFHIFRVIPQLTDILQGKPPINIYI